MKNAMSRSNDPSGLLALESEMLRALFDDNPDFLFFKDRHSRVLRTNKAHSAACLGLTDPAKAVGLTDFDVFPRDDAQRFFDEEQRIMDTKVPVIAREWSIPGPEGRTKWLSEHKLPFVDANGVVRGLIGIGRDITQLRETRAAIAHERDLLHALMNNSPDFLFFKDRQSRFIRTNKAHCRACLGLDDPAKAIGLTDFDIFPREDAQRFFDEEQRIMETKIPVIAREWSIPGPEGRTKWLSEHKLPFVDADGMVCGLIGVGRDITQLREAQEAVAHERDLLHALMDNIPDLIYFKDIESRYTRVNKAHAQALGLANPDQAIGRSDASLFPSERTRRSQEEERALMSERRSLLDKLEHDERRGRWYLTTKVSLKDSAGRVTGLIGISRDVTAHRKGEEKLEKDLDAFLAVVNACAQGDLTRRGVEGEDTLGRIARSVNQMLESFSTILTGARDAALSVSASASEILAAANQIVKGAQYGSDEVAAMSATVKEMAQSMTQVSRHAEDSVAAAKEVLEHVHKGQASVNATAVGMTSIDSAVSQTAEKMRLLEKRSRQIVEIIGLLEEIASQSTLLSLNAAIEAAHAGDAGRGFGVVAEEIRRLASKSTKSTKEATEVVEGIVEETRVVLNAMENGLREVQGGRDLSERAQESLRRIQALVDRSVAFSEQISSASREQARVTQTVTRAMQTIADMTNQSSAGAKETSRAVKDMVDLSENLMRAIARFKLAAAGQ